MFCSNCGHDLAPDVKFCSNCGAPVNSGASSGTPDESDKNRRERERREDFENAWGGTADATPTDNQPSEPVEDSSTDEYSDEQYSGGFATKRPEWEVQREQLRDEPADEWSMSDLGPVAPKRRRKWLWVLLITLAVIAIACCVFGYWISFTDSGNDFVNDLATQQADLLSTREADEATPQP